MEKQKPFKMKLWMWVFLLVAVLLLIVNYDPLGDGLERLFGKEADRWATNILIGLVVCVSFFLKKK